MMSTKARILPAGLLAVLLAAGCSGPADDSAPATAQAQAPAPVDPDDLAREVVLAPLPEEVDVPVWSPT